MRRLRPYIYHHCLKYSWYSLYTRFRNTFSSDFFNDCQLCKLWREQLKRYRRCRLRVGSTEVTTRPMWLTRPCRRNAARQWDALWCLRSCPAVTYIHRIVMTHGAPPVSIDDDQPTETISLVTRAFIICFAVPPPMIGLALRQARPQRRLSLACPMCTPYESQQNRHVTKHMERGFERALILLRYWRYTYGDSGVISSYQLFPTILWGKLCEMFVVLTLVDVTFSMR